MQPIEELLLEAYYLLKGLQDVEKYNLKVTGWYSDGSLANFNDMVEMSQIKDINHRLAVKFTDMDVQY